MSSSRMACFTHLAYSVIDPPHQAPNDAIRDALVAHGSNPRVMLTPSSYGAMLVMFKSNAVHEHSMNAQPFLSREHSITLECHDETANLFHFEHGALISLAIKDFPMEHWNCEYIVYSMRPYANPHLVDPIYLHGIDFSAVLLMVKA